MPHISNRPVDWEALVTDNENRLYRAALAILGDSQEAEDAVQDAFLVFLEKAPADLDRPDAWLMRVLETETFELWMSKIMERFDRHDQMLSKLAGKEIKEVKYLDGERLLDNQDLCQLLQASKRSLQRYRSSGTLRYQMLWHKIYYKESDVQEFLKNHFDEFEGCRKVDKRGR